MPVRKHFKNVFTGNENLISSSNLNDEEMFVCIYYFYHFCSLGTNEFDLHEYEYFETFWNMVQRFKKEKQLGEILGKLINHYRKTGLLTECNDFKGRAFRHTNITMKYYCDDEVNREIPDKYMCQAAIDLYRCILIDGVEIIMLLIRMLFFESKFKKARQGKDSIVLSDEVSKETIKLDGTVRIEDFKPQYAKILSDLSKVQFIIDLVGLSENEARYLLVYYRFLTNDILVQYWKNVNYRRHAVMQAVLGITTTEYNLLTHKNGKLKSNGFIGRDNILDNDLKDCITNGSIDLFFADFVREIDCSKAYKSSSFSVPKEKTDIMKRFLNGTMNSSILLYGKPGAGKTEYAKSLVKECNYKAFIFKNEAELQGEGKALFRFNCYLSMKGKDTILIIDEADKLLQTKDMNSFMGTIPNGMKGTVNKMLENSCFKTIWIVNYSNQIDISTKRRFTYSYHFEAMTEKQLRTIAADKLKKLKLDNSITNTILEMLGKYKVTGSSVDNIVNVAKEMHELEKDNLLNVVEDILEENAQLVNGKRSMRQIVGEEYDLSVLNTSIEADQILEMTQNALVYAERHENANNGIRMLFYGLSGTGKTELARYMSQKLGKDILLKRASDILGMYVGESEKNIKQAFDEAERTGSILLFDEADSFFADRNNAQHSWERTIVNEFLTQMEEFKGILICTTNLKKIMDSAMQRRFHFCVEFKPLEKNGIQTMLERYFPEYKFTKDDVQTLENSGSVTPGDFGTLSSRIRFMNQSKVNSFVITKELIDLQKEKKNGSFCQKMGFNT